MVYLPSSNPTPSCGTDVLNVPLSSLSTQTNIATQFLRGTEASSSFPELNVSEHIEFIPSLNSNRDANLEKEKEDILLRNE